MKILAALLIFAMAAVAPEPEPQHLQGGRRLQATPNSTNYITTPKGFNHV